MKIGILGSGLMGGKLGMLLAQAGHEVIFSYSRRQSKLDDLARRAGSSATTGTPADAATADVVLLAVHWSRLDDVLSQAGDLAGKTVVTCCVPLDDTDSRLVVGTPIPAQNRLPENYPRHGWQPPFRQLRARCSLKYLQRVNARERQAVFIVVMMLTPSALL